GYCGCCVCCGGTGDSATITPGRHTGQGRSLATSHGTDAQRVERVGAVHEAGQEVDEPRERREACEGRRRPGATRSGRTWETGSNGRIWERLAIVHNALQCLDIRQAPVPVPCIPALTAADPLT